MVGLNYFRSREALSPEASLDELAQLTRTAGGEVVHRILVGKEQRHPNHYFGKGKIDELQSAITDHEIDLLIVDDELSVRQQLQLDQRLSCRIIDRTTLILQIFADRAQTREGQLQIELAQLSYLMPRLMGKGKDLSRLGGGIGTRGPGETQLEKDRRHVRQRIHYLNQSIQDIRQQRQINRQRRQNNAIPVIALVGYTNAGKSTLLSALTDAWAYAEDKLFATLDPKTRRLTLDGKEMLLTDTVGFIHNLPHALVKAFRATLEEATYSDLLIHVVDASHPQMKEQIATVQKVLSEINCGDKPMIHVFNKMDQIKDPIELHHWIQDHAPAIMISATEKCHLEELKQLIHDQLAPTTKPYRFLIPHENSQVLNRLYEQSKVEEVEYIEEGITGIAYFNPRQATQFSDYLVEERSSNP